MNKMYKSYWQWADVMFFDSTNTDAQQFCNRDTIIQEGQDGDMNDFLQITREVWRLDFREYEIKWNVLVKWF